MPLNLTLMAQLNCSDKQDFHWEFSAALSDIVLGYKEVYARPLRGISSCCLWDHVSGPKLAFSLVCNVSYSVIELRKLGVIL